ncbi:MAG TPA: hypothetical protein DCR46_04280 [Cytophagales bacterium]|nr:hypothetical protein [Cytophagales bacterium]
MSKKLYYLKADFTADYSGNKLEYGSELYKRSFNANFSNVVLENVSPISNWRRNHYRLGNDFIENLHLQEVHIKIPNQNHYAKATITEGILRNPVITESGKTGDTTLGKVKGTIYAAIEKPLPEETLEEAEVSESIVDTKSDWQKVGKTTFTNRRFGIANWISGCFSMFVWLFLALLISSFFLLGWSWLNGLLKIILIIIGIYLLFKIFGFLLKAIAGIFALLLFFLFILFLFSYLFSHSKIQDQDKKRAQTEQGDEIDEQSELTKDTTLASKDNVSCKNNPLLAVHHRRWTDFAPLKHEGNLIMSQCNYHHSRQNRESFSPIGHDMVSQFNQVYKRLIQNDKNKMQLVYQVFDSLRTAHHLDDSKFADLIVTCVQDIPYKLVIDNPSDLDGRMLEYYKENGALEHIKFGVQAPAEFMYNLKGDCDTRALFCFTVLDHFGFDTAILISSYYAHAILGLAIPSTGHHLTFNGKRYYTWETTAKGFQLGQMAPDCDNMNYWQIILTNN